MAEVEDVAKLALKLHRKHSKASMSMALAGLLQHGSMLQINKVVQDQLDGTNGIKLKHIKELAKGNYEQ